MYCFRVKMHLICNNILHTAQIKKFGLSSNLCRKRSRRLMNVMDLLPPKRILPNQPFKYLLVTDLEATCFDEFAYPAVQEIIEFPVLKVNSKTLKVEAVFHEFVRPRVSPQLSDYCTSLICVDQEDVDKASYFPEVLSRFTEWHRREVGSETSLVVTCGDWDMLTMMPKQCALDGLPVPPIFRIWHNLKLSYYAATKTYSKSLHGIMDGLDLQRSGREHCGIDDCHTISDALCELIRRGLVIVPTKKIKNDIP